MRFSFEYTTEGSPQRLATQAVIKYVGVESKPQWTDVKQGNVFGLSADFSKVIEVKQTSSRRCVVYKQISPLLRIR